MRRFAVLVAVLGLVAAACSSTDDDATSSETSETSAPSTETTAEPPDGSSSSTEVDAVPDLPEGSTRGVSDDAIKIAVLELDLTDVFGETGADLAVANTLAGESYKVFADDINARGGINGRMIDLKIFGFSVIDDAKTQSACIESTEDFQSFAVIAMGGLSADGVLCLAEAQDTLTIASGFATEEDLARLDGKLFITGMNETRQYRTWIQAMHEEGILAGKTIGLIYESSLEAAMAMKAGAIPTLEELGYDVAATVELPCEARRCTQYENGVEVLKDAGVDLVIDGMNGLSNPPLIDAAIAANYFPRYAPIPFNTAGTLTELVALDSESRRDAYAGAVSANGDPNLADLHPEFPLPRPPQPGEASYECNNRYTEVTGRGFDFDPTGTAENNDSRGLIAGACQVMELLAYAMTQAGDDLDDVRVAYELQQIEDWNDVLPWTPVLDDPDHIELGWDDGKFDAANRYTLVEFDPEIIDWRPMTDQYWWAQ